jgi:hypothetical protein
LIFRHKSWSIHEQYRPTADCNMLCTAYVYVCPYIRHHVPTCLTTCKLRTRHPNGNTPRPLPPKTGPSFGSIFGAFDDQQLVESRRRGLEAYLAAILTSADDRWRNCSEWSQFLRLPSGVTAAGDVAATLGSAASSLLSSSAASLSQQNGSRPGSTRSPYQAGSTNSIRTAVI